MKKAFIFILLTAFAVAANSQDGNLKKQTYFRLGLSIPTWKYMGFDNKDDWGDDTRRTGGIFEVGSIFMLNSIKIAHDMRIGINVDYLSIDYNRFSTKGSDFSDNFAYIGSKIGPSFSYSPVSKLVFDTYFKFHPVWVAGDFISYKDENFDDEFYLGFIGIKYSVGLNVRYSIAMLGFEINPGFARFKQYDDDENKLSDIYLGNADDNGDRTPVPAFHVTLGLSF